MKTGDINIISVNECASEILSEIHHAAFQDAPEQSWMPDEFNSMFSVPGTEGFVIQLGENPIGFALTRTVLDEAEIITFCILPNHTKSGYATVLLEQVVKELQQRSLKRLFLEVRENNDAAIRLYKKCHFDIIGRRTGYYHNRQGQKTDAIVMQRDLAKNE